jgi:predicted nuclease with TOPRIM domain
MRSARTKELDFAKRQMLSLKNRVDQLQVVTDAFFPMFDNLDNAVTDRTAEIHTLKGKVAELERQNSDLHERLDQKSNDFEGLFDALRCHFDEQLATHKQQQERELESLK